MEQQSNYESEISMSPSIGQAIRELPDQYFKVLSKSSVTTFVEEKGKANWGMNWFQFIALGLIGAVLQSIDLLISPPDFSHVAGTWLLYLPHIYSLVLLILAMRAVHQSDSEKARDER